MTFTVLFHPEAARELETIEPDIKKRLKKALADKLMTRPDLYGKPLRATLKGYWKIRVGDFRIVYAIQGSELIIYAIRHRKEIYRVVGFRTG